MKIAIVANSAWYLQNFRLNLAGRLRDAGHQVVFISPMDGYEKVLNAARFEHYSWQLESSSINPIRELNAVLKLRRFFQSDKFDAVLSYTPKANIYCGLALAGRSKCRFLPNVSGLGRAFIQRSLLTHLVITLYRVAFRRAYRIIFQNEDDQFIFVRQGLARQEKTLRVPGSGVDLQRFHPSTRMQSPSEKMHFLFVGRLLRDKGITELFEAAARIKQDWPDVTFTLLGSSQAANPSAISPKLLQQWTEAQIVVHHEHVDDVRPYIDAADCVLLPSYREGVPRSLLEASAMSKPIIATDAPGCRDTVVDTVTGLLCAPGSALDLERVLRQMISLSPVERASMGRAGRHRIEIEFNEELVIAAYTSLIA